MTWNWIPQLFYDFVGRVIPGLSLIIVSILIVLGPTGAMASLLAIPSKKDLFGFGPIFLFLIVSYVVGMICGQLWEVLLGKVYRRIERNIETACKEACLIEHNRILQALEKPVMKLAADKLPRAFVMVDHLRPVAETEAWRLLKLTAEQRLCQVLTLGFFVLAIINVVYFAIHPALDRAVMEALLILSIIACWQRSLRLKEYSVNGTCIAWLLHVAPNQVLPKPKPKECNRIETEGSEIKPAV